MIFQNIRKTIRQTIKLRQVPVIFMIFSEIMIRCFCNSRIIGSDVTVNMQGLFRRQQIISQGHMVKGLVVCVKTCWWLKINLKPFRANSMDGATFPHLIFFRYNVDNVEYRGSRSIRATECCPLIGETIDVYYSVSRPSVYTVNI